MATTKRNRAAKPQTPTPTPQERAQACLAEIDAVLVRHRCRLEAAPSIDDGRIVATLTIRALGE